MLTFDVNRPVTAAQFRDLLVRSTLGERRPIDQTDTLRGMLEHASLVATCWHGELLVGIARSVTDYHFCCYLSDLAVDCAYQRQGIGRQLIDLTQSQLADGCTIVLLAAPAAESYYPRLGFDRHPQAWTLPRTRRVAGSRNEANRGTSEEPGPG